MKVKHRLEKVEKTLKVHNDQDKVISYWSIPEEERELLLDVSRCVQMYLNWSRDLPKRACLDDIVNKIYYRIILRDPTGWADRGDLNKIFDEIYQETLKPGIAQLP